MIISQIATLTSDISEFAGSVNVNVTVSILVAFG